MKKKLIVSIALAATCGSTHIVADDIGAGRPDNIPEATEPETNETEINLWEPWWEPVLQWFEPTKE